MTHRIVVNVQTGEIVQVEYTAEEHDAAVAAAAEVVVEPVVVEPVVVVVPEEPTE
jgi:hypothetical protein